MNFFEKKYTVASHEIDEYNHVNNVVYVQWIQDVADAHWQLLSKRAENIPYVWFVIRHEIDYKGQAKLNDGVSIKTWVGKTEGVKSVRHVEIYRGTSLLVKSETTYCLINKETLKPSRIPQEIKDLLIPEDIN